MHPMTSHQVALQQQRRILDRAAADRLARQATAGRPSLITRLLQAVRRDARPVARPTSRPAAGATPTVTAPRPAMTADPRTTSTVRT